MREVVKLTVQHRDRTVGTLAETSNGEVAFQYDNGWLADGFSISPFSLPLEPRVFLPVKDVFDGLFGVFADSLPDGWGRLLVDRMLLSRSIEPDLVSQITRLGIVGSSGMGALEYVPELMNIRSDEMHSFDEMAAECEKVLSEQDSSNLDALFQLGASSGGARPKALLDIEGEAWMVKFPSTYDRKSIGSEEFRYMQCAGKCGVEVPQVKLFPSELCEGYFGAKRFDREKGEKRHMLTVSALLETSHRTPNLDYNDLMKLTYMLTQDNTQMKELYRRMCFNVFAHNRDDHSKNFTFIYQEDEARWKLSPVYDLTYSNSVGGWHATCVAGNGMNPSLPDLLRVARCAGMNEAKAKHTALEIEDIVRRELGDIIESYA